jgi:hypothetical protein
MCLALLHHGQALGGVGDDGEGELDADLILGSLQKLAEELPIWGPFTHPLELDW